MGDRTVSIEEANRVGALLNIPAGSIDVSQFRRGLEVECEHGTRDPQTNITDDDVAMTGKIAWAHLKEIPDYYARLDRLEADTAAARLLNG